MALSKIGPEMAYKRHLRLIEGELQPICDIINKKLSNSFINGFSVDVILDNTVKLEYINFIISEYKLVGWDVEFSSTSNGSRFLTFSRKKEH